MAEIFVNPRPVPVIPELVEQYLEGKTQPASGIPKPQRMHFGMPKNYPTNADAMEYRPEVDMFLPKGLVLPPPEDHCVCTICNRCVCTCVEEQENPTAEQIGVCIVHGEDMAAADIYRAIHAAHNMAITREIAGEQ